jgi:hypothetical protein
MKRLEELKKKREAKATTLTNGYEKMDHGTRSCHCVATWKVKIKYKQG